MKEQTVSFSDLEAFRRCERLYHWEHVKGIRPHETIPSFIKGNAIRAFLASLHSGRTQAEALAATEQFEFVPNDLKDIKRVCREYVGYWGEEPDRMPGGGLLGVDETFDVRIEPRSEIAFRLVGTSDLLWQDPRKGIDGVVVEIHKTTSVMRRDFENRLVGNHQLLLHAYALRLNGRNPTRAVFNVLRTQPPRTPRVNRDGSLSKQKCSTTAEKYLATMRKTGCMGEPWSGHLESLRSRGNQFFYRLEQDLSESLIAQAVEDAGETVWAISKALIHGQWEANVESCQSEFGRCPYLARCNRQDVSQDHELVSAIGVYEDLSRPIKATSVAEPSSTVMSAVPSSPRPGIASNHPPEVLHSSFDFPPESPPVGAACSFCGGIAHGGGGVDRVPLYKVRSTWLNDSTRKLKYPCLQERGEVELRRCGKCEESRSVSGSYALAGCWVPVVCGLVGFLLAVWKFWTATRGFHWIFLMPCAISAIVCGALGTWFVNRLESAALKRRNLSRLPQPLEVAKMRGMIPAGWVTELPPNTRQEGWYTASRRRSGGR